MALKSLLPDVCIWWRAENCGQLSIFWLFETDPFWCATGETGDDGNKLFPGSHSIIKWIKRALFTPRPPSVKQVNWLFISSLFYIFMEMLFDILCSCFRMFHFVGFMCCCRSTGILHFKFSSFTVGVPIYIIQWLLIFKFCE